MISFYNKNIEMWKDVIFYGVSSIFTYFNTKQMCDMSHLHVILGVNMFINILTLITVAIKKPIRVIDNRVDYT